MPDVGHISPDLDLDFEPREPSAPAPLTKQPTRGGRGTITGGAASPVARGSRLQRGSTRPAEQSGRKFGGYGEGLEALFTIEDALRESDTARDAAREAVRAESKEGRGEPAAAGRKSEARARKSEAPAAGASPAQSLLPFGGLLPEWSDWRQPRGRRSFIVPKQAKSESKSERYASRADSDKVTLPPEGEVVVALRTPNDPELVQEAYADILPRAKVRADDANARLHEHLLDTIEERRRQRWSTNPARPDRDDLPLPREPSTSVDPARFLSTAQKKQRREFANFWVYNATRTFEAGKRRRNRALHERKPVQPWPPPPVKLSSIKKNVLEFSSFCREADGERKREEMVRAMAAERNNAEREEKKKQQAVNSAKKLTEQMGMGRRPLRKGLSRQNSKTLPS